MSNQPTPVTVLRRPAGRVQAAALALAFAAAALAVAAPVRAVGGDGLREAANAYRIDRHLTPVIGTPLLDDIAVHRAAHMANQNKLKHDMEYVQDRLNRSGVCWRGFGEIIAWERGYPDYSSERTVEQWWESDPHRDVMLGEDYNAAGGAWDTASDTGHYSVMVFVTLCNPSTSGSTVSVLRPDDRYSPDRHMVFQKGRMTGYRFSASGKVLGTKTVRFRSTAKATSAGRAELDGRAWLKVSSGRLSGFWVRESSDAFVRGFTEKVHFQPDRRLVAEAGRYVGRKFDWLGRVTDARWATWSHDRTPGASARAIINGRRYFQIGAGPFAGYWIRDDDKVFPR